MLFVIVLLSGFAVCTVVLSPVVFRLSVATHEYVEFTLLVKGILTVPPLQIVALLGFVIIGVGSTVTVIVCGVPKHPCGLDVGVTVYVTV